MSVFGYLAWANAQKKKHFFFAPFHVFLASVKTPNSENPKKKETKLVWLLRKKKLLFLFCSWKVRRFLLLLDTQSKPPE